MRKVLLDLDVLRIYEYGEEVEFEANSYGTFTDPRFGAADVDKIIEVLTKWRSRQ